MPKALELSEIDGELWVRIGKPGDFPSGVEPWTPDEQKAAKRSVLTNIQARTHNEILKLENPYPPPIFGTDYFFESIEALKKMFD